MRMMELWPVELLIPLSVGRRRSQVSCKISRRVFEDMGLRKLSNVRLIVHYGLGASFTFYPIKSFDACPEVTGHLTWGPLVT